MRKSQQVALDIQNTCTRVRSGVSLSTRELLTLSDEYNKLIDAINKRLHEAVFLLHRGYRSEALQDAESIPPILEEAAALDLNGAHEWADICQQHELPSPSQIDLNRASELNNAYFVELRLTPLLVRNRRLALSRAPTEVRIQILKHLAEEDRSNPLWAQDLATFEKARLREIERDLPGIIRAGNIAQAEKLRQELSGKWIEPIPDVMRRQVEDLYQSLKTKAAQDALPQLQQQILQAHAQSNAQVLRDALARWDERASAAHNTEPPAEILAARTWLHDFDRATTQDRLYTTALMELESTLDAKNSSPQLKTELERAWAKVQKFDRPLPQVLITRYETRRAELQIDSRRRFVVLAVGTGCAILIIGLGVAFAIHLTLQASQTSQWTSTLDKATAEDRLDDAQGIIKQIQQDLPKASSNPALADSLSRAQAAVNEDQTRAQRFELAMSSSEQAGPAAVDQNTLDTAQRLAKRDAEQVRLERFTAQVKAARQKELLARDGEFKNSLEAVRERFVQAKDNVTLSPSDRAIQMQAIADDLRKLTARGDVSPGIKGAGDILLSNVLTVLKGAQDAVDQARKRTETLDRLRILMGTPSEYAKALQGFAQENPDNPLSPEFTRAASFKSIWTSARFWADTLPALPPASDAGATEDVRKKVADALAADASEPFKTQLTGLENYLARRNRFAIDRPWDERLKRALDLSFVSSLMMVQTKAVAGIPPARYYILPTTQPVLEKDAKGKEIYAFPYVTSIAQAAGAEPPSGVAQIPVDIYTPPVKSPQSLFAEQARPLLSERNALAQWEAWHVLFLEYASRPNSTNKIDPLLHANLAQLILPGAIKYDLISDKKPVEDLIKSLSAFKIDDSFLNPMSQVADKQRQQLKDQAAPDTWPDFKPIIATALTAGQTLRDIAHRTTTRKPVAIVFPDENGAMSIQSQFRDNQTPMVLEALYVDPQGQGAIRQLGIARDQGKLELLPGAFDQLPAGTLVYGSTIPETKPAGKQP
jgi:hypothetical protein